MQIHQIIVGSLVGLSLFSVGCQHEAPASAAATPPPPLVAVMTVHHEDVPIFNEYAAQTYARDLVEVRGRVDGFIEKRLFQVGSDVKAGQGVYTLDLGPYEAVVSRA